MNKKKVTKKPVSKKTTKGKDSVKKGAKFEDKVADLYRLLGADVIPNIEICQKKVDIFATFPLPGCSVGHRIIVECKNEKKAVAQNQRVMQFKGLLNVARESNKADSAEIITRVPWSNQAKGFARDSGIALLTYTEKIAQLIDFSNYLKDTIARFETRNPDQPNEPSLNAYYVDIRAGHKTKNGTEKADMIEKFIYKWMQNNNNRQLAILGEYGTGKTSLCLKLSHDMATLYLKEPGSNRIPILFNLREFTKTLKIESLVTSFLDEECGVINPRFKLFKTMNEAGIFLLIFDGFDEMAVRVDSDTLEMNLQEIEKLAIPQNCKVTITCRTEYFISGEEEKRSLRPKEEILATRDVEYEPLIILPWNDKQVDSFLKKRVPLIKGKKKNWSYYRDRIRNISGLSDLSRRPVLLDMIVKTLPQLIEIGKPINRPNLYETYLKKEIKRQKIIKKRIFLLSENIRFSLLQKLAIDFYDEKIKTITFSDAQKYISRIVKPPKDELEAFTRDFLTCSFLIRKGDEYQFSHRSIMEYLIAKELNEEIKSNKPGVFLKQKLNYIVAGFLVELLPDTDILWNWINSTKGSDKERIKYKGGNAATLISRLDLASFVKKDLSKTVLIGAQLDSLSLRGTNLKGTIMEDCVLINAQFLKKDLAHANLKNCVFSLYIISEKKIAGDIKNIEYFEIIINKLFPDYQRRKQLPKEFISIETSSFNGMYFVEIVLIAENIEKMEYLKNRAITLKEVQASAFYYDEIESLLAEISEPNRSDINKRFFHREYY